MSLRKVQILDQQDHVSWPINFLTGVSPLYGIVCWKKIRFRLILMEGFIYSYKDDALHKATGKILFDTQYI